MIALLLGLRLASASCPTLEDAVHDAHAAFDDAEVELASAKVRDGYAAIGCQTGPVRNEALLDLYWLDAVVAIARNDRKTAQYAVIRAVTAAPEKGPPQDLGPELAELYATWRGRLEATTATVQPAGGGKAWLDGVPFDAPRRVLQGEHVFQHDDVDGFTSVEVDVTHDTVLDTGLPGGPTPVVVAPVKPEKPEKPPKVDKPEVKRPVPLVTIGAVAVAAGGGAIAAGGLRERQFAAAPYDADVYGGCSRDQACWADARSTEIRADASQINLTYGTGYGLLGLGAAMVSVAAATWGSPTADVHVVVGPTSLGVVGRF